jgi:hypothetical protein
MFNYNPEKVKDYENDPAIGYLVADFEPFQPHPNYDFKRQVPPKNVWKTVVPKTAPRIGNLPQVVQDMIKMTWKIAEPAKDAPRLAPNHNPVFMGTRGMAQNSFANATYRPQVMPYDRIVVTKMGNKDAIATDWAEFNQVERTNAVTFRGDLRSPIQVIKGAGGFYPPNTRTDRGYLVKKIYPGFKSYLKRRYDRDLPEDVFLKAVDSAAPTDEDKKTLADYVMWRRIMEKESSHLARMTDNELLKGYISTARAIDTSIDFGTAFGTEPGWLYLTVVHGGFIVPWGKGKVWGTEEGEIAQLGPVPAERIVGFRRLDKPSILERYQPVGPVFIRHSFRKSEPEALEKMFKIMSGKVP